ncbi:MAG: TetR/AcrR family transcriptional regulator [Hyphomicrobiales bacterium]|nr:TetR/AcrR family transcriptional regulator [Hyphomicrobiales bacterium]
MTDENPKGALQGRRAAGQDASKRRQILEGARQVFSAQGFDAASMNDITQAAGVSKGTIYVYFQSKEQLFVALIAEERERMAAELFEAIEDEPDVAQALALFGRRLVRLLTRDHVLRAQRIVLGVAERMPDLGREFFEAGPMRTRARLEAYFDRHVAAGRLVIGDTALAASQFIELSAGWLLRQRLYGAVREAPTDAETARHVDGAVALFMSAYRSADSPAAR